MSKIRAVCMPSCELLDIADQRFPCDEIRPFTNRSWEACLETCRETKSCKQVVFDGAGGGTCSISAHRETKVAWASDNFKSAFCGSGLRDDLAQVRTQLPFRLPVQPLVNCSWAGEDCFQSKCCNDLACDKNFTACRGYQCYKQSAGFSGCLLDAPPSSWEGTRLGGLRQHRLIGPAGSQAQVQGTSLYCFTVVSWHSPAPKPFWNTEAELADNIKAKGVGICQCDAHDWYSAVPSPKAEWGSFSNIDSFRQIWKEVQAKGDYRRYDWVVKVDADAVFIPSRLKQHLQKLRAPLGARVYLENINYRFKFMGALEILSRAAVDTYLALADTCIRGKHDGGEDFFMKGCMDSLGIDHMVDHDLLHDKYARLDGPCTDGWAVAYHFHKKVISWNWCYNEVMCGTRAKSCPAGVDVPYVVPWELAH